MRTSSAPTIRLKNYAPPAYSVTEVKLDFQLEAKKAHVRCEMLVRRMADTASDAPLVLDGDELNLHALKINGEAPDKASFKASPSKLAISQLPSDETFTVEIETVLNPAANTKLMGLYQSNGVFCTQCEAEGFRRITYFLDRPDVLAVYTVRVEADKSLCKHLLSNGNMVEAGPAEGNKHFAVWHDPHPKPSYLFALVAGNLDALSDTFTTASRRDVALNIFVEKGKAPLAEYAMDSLKRSMTWDEEHYGREYDLDVFNIVAVSDFNMGAMENKGLNVFNDKYVLANPDVATDSDYANIEAIIAHEYFHNWTGNRITCRDWFQLCLKEGLTVYRDQEFSADQRSRAVQRIHQVRVLKAGQFKEDAGPLAHPVRPNAYKEINNFYTATIYQKGAELVRMLATLVEPENYRKATDLYFERHDGEAAIMEDFIRCFEEISGRDLSQFMFWYEQAGTPEVSVTESWNEESSTYSLELVQTVPPTPGKTRKKSVPIPVRFGFLDRDGNEFLAHTESPSVSGDVILLEKKRTRVKFTKLSQKPIVSLLRGFSAPVNLDFSEPKQNRLIRAKFDPDLYNRWDALNGYLVAEMARMSAGGEANTDTDALLETLSDTVFETATEPAFRALVLSLPSVGEVARHIASNVNPDTIHNARMGLMRNIAQTLGAEGVELISALGQTIKTSSPLEAVGQRSLKNALLSLAVAGKQSSALELAIKQFETAENMTDRIFAFSTLLHYQDDTKIAEDASQSFYDRFADNALVVNSWFSIHAATPGKHGLAKINELLEHEQFTLTNPNRARSLLGPFASANLTAFHQTDGSGYKLFLGEIKKLDDMNPQIAARLLTLMGDWRMYSDERVAAAKHHLTELANSKGLSKDVQEIVDRSLG